MTRRIGRSFSRSFTFSFKTDNIRRLRRFNKEFTRANTAGFAGRELPYRPPGRTRPRQFDQTLILRLHEDDDLDISIREILLKNNLCLLKFLRRGRYG